MVAITVSWTMIRILGGTIFLNREITTLDTAMTTTTESASTMEGFSFKPFPSMLEEARYRFILYLPLAARNKLPVTHVDIFQSVTTLCIKDHRAALTKSELCTGYRYIASYDLHTEQIREISQQVLNRENLDFELFAFAYNRDDPAGPVYVTSTPAKAGYCNCAQLIAVEPDHPLLKEQQ